jgi:predicted DNA binding CopG/RHH family protein
VQNKLKTKSTGNKIHEFRCQASTGSLTDEDSEMSTPRKAEWAKKHICVRLRLSIIHIYEIKIKIKGFP